MSESLLVVGSGGREHALGWKLGQSAEHLSFLPGNAGTLEIGENIIAELDNIDSIASLALSRHAFTVVGPDRPLAAGIVNRFNQLGLPIFGPTLEAAQLESSKKFAYDFNAEEGIPQAEGPNFDNIDDAWHFAISRNPLSYVIKVDGLADGKGVVLPKTHTEVLTYLETFMVNRIFGKSGDVVLFPERLEGPELSVFALCDGQEYIKLPSFRDHKRLLDNDEGPNTGGMGVYGPIEVDEATQKIIDEQIIQKVLNGMQKRGTPYKGILYVGLMLTKDGPKVIEYNARFGDPECQAQMLLAGDDLYPAMRESATGKLKSNHLNWRPGHVVSVALTADGYPEVPRTGDEIFGLDLELPEETVVFHAGTTNKGGKVVTNGGRVLHIASYGETIELAKERAYQSIGEHAIHFSGNHFRKDIVKN